MIKWLTVWVLVVLMVGQAVALPPALPVPRKNQSHEKVLTLKEAILLALRMNPNVRSAEIQRVADKFALEVAHNAYEPQLSIGANATFTNGNRPQYSATPVVNWKTPLGTQVQLQYNPTFQGLVGSQSLITATVTQHLLQGFGPKVNMAPLEQAEYTEDSNRLALKTVVMQGITAVIQAYYQLAQDYNNLTTQQAALANSLQIVQQMQVQIKAGKVAPLELAPQQTQVANQELAVTQAKNQIEQDYQALLTVLGLDPHSHITIDKNIQAIPDIKLDLNQNTRYALENNIDYLNAVYGLKQSEIAVLLAKDQQKWTLDAVATENIQANNNGNQIGGLNLNTANARSLALNLTIPIDNKATQQQLVNAQVALDRAKIALDETRRSLRANVLTQMQSLVFQRQQILQAQQAVKFAEQAFNTELIKLKYGRTTVLSVTQLRDSLTQARLAAIAQQIAYINALAQFEQLVGITLDKWSIQIYY